MKTDETKIVKIAVLASGNGSNAENIVNFLRGGDYRAAVELIITNKAEAGVIERGRRLGVDVMVVPAADFRDPSKVIPLLEGRDIGMIVLAGFLLMVPAFLIERYRGRIVNIHPSLLPRHGGKGMYGHHVHEAVVAAGDTETGITIHEVSEVCDGGRILFQAKVAVAAGDTPADVEAKIHPLEYTHYPRVIAEMAAWISAGKAH